MPIAAFTRPGLPTLAYDAVPPVEVGRPWVVFLGGFNSAMAGTKASFLADTVAARGDGYLRFDYSGHGQSEGAFTDGTVGGWTAEALALIDTVTGEGAGDPPLILVGSSMGAWIAVLVALARPERVAGLVGVAAACDFTEEVVAARLGPEQRDAIARQGWFDRPSRYGDGPYRIAGRLLEEARAHLVLRRPLPITAPVRLLHGQADPDIDWRTSLRLMAQIEGTDVSLTLIKDGDHRLARPEDLAALDRTVADLCAGARAVNATPPFATTEAP